MAEMQFVTKRKGKASHRAVQLFECDLPWQMMRPQMQQESARACKTFACSTQKGFCGISAATTFHVQHAIRLHLTYDFAIASKHASEHATIYARSSTCFLPLSSTIS